MADRVVRPVAGDGRVSRRHVAERDGIPPPDRGRRARPFRDLLLGLFFVTVGMELDYQLLPAMWLETLVLLFGITIGKGLLIVGLVMARMGTAAAVRTGLILGHGGEFGIALLALALGRDVLSHETAQPVLAAMIISMLIAPVVVRHNRAAIARRLLAGQGDELTADAMDVREHARAVFDHVVIAGFGRLGQNLAVILRKLDIPYVALDLDAGVIRQARLAGEPVFYGDCTHVSILQHAGLARSRAMVITFDEPEVVTRALASARAVGASTDVLVRTRDDRHFELLLDKGCARSSWRPSKPVWRWPITCCAALTMPRRTSSRCSTASGGPVERTTFCVVGDDTRRASDQPGLQTVCVTDRAHAVGCRLGDLHLDEIGAQVVAIRSGIRGDKPLADTRLRANDAVVLEGTIEQFDRARQRMLNG